MLKGVVKRGEMVGLVLEGVVEGVAEGIRVLNLRSDSERRRVSRCRWRGWARGMAGTAWGDIGGQGVETGGLGALPGEE